MRDPGLEELESALARFCDEVLSDITVPTPDGLRRQVRWRYRGQEFRASLLVSGDLSLFQYARWRRHGERFEHLPSRPVFEFQTGSSDWLIASHVGLWHWALRTAGRRDAGDESPGDLAGRPVRPRPGLPSLSAGAVVIPELVEREVSYHPIAALPRRGAGDDELGRAPRWR
jgi:hypothetical protein